jgi:hypothetical protein
MIVCSEYIQNSFRIHSELKDKYTSREKIFYRLKQDLFNTNNECYFFQTKHICMVINATVNKTKKLNSKQFHRHQNNHIKHTFMQLLKNKISIPINKRNEFKGTKNLDTDESAG